MVGAPDLPVDGELSAIIDELRRNAALVLQAEPGAGKTTRVPAALESRFVHPHHERSRVLISEPRRVAARLAATRVADEVGCELGDKVGYSVRFEERCSPATTVHFMTEGVLLRHVLRPGGLDDVKVVVIDEFHERHLETDLLLALLRRACSAPNGPRLVVMSATLDADALAAFLDCKAFHVPGRTFPLTIEHQLAPSELPIERQMAAAIRTAVAATPGHVLAFLPGTREIRMTQELLMARGAPQGCKVLPLHGQLSLGEQTEAVRPSAQRKIVLATNVAESSVTVDGVTCVVDSGLERRAHDSAWGGQRRLDVVPVSQHSATQRAGRAGRTGPGTVIRLYAEADLVRRPKSDKPEIERLDLVDFLLMIVAHGLTVDELSWLCEPPANALAAARSLLYRLGAVDRAGHATPLGRQLAQLPLPARLARLFVECLARGIARQGALAAALLSERDIRGSRTRDLPAGPSDLQERLDAYGEGASSDFRPAALRAIGLEGARVREVARVAGRLKDHARRMKTGASAEAALSPDEADEQLRRALLVAFSDCVAQRRTTNNREFVLQSGATARLDDDSVVTTASFVVVLNAGERSRLDRRPGPRSVLKWVSAIEPDWLLDGATDLETRSSLEFNRAKGSVEIVEQLMYGALVLDSSRSLAPPGPERAALLFEAAKAQQAAIFGKRNSVDSTLARLAFFRRQTGESSANQTTPLDILRAACETCGTLEDLSNIDWHAFILASLTATQRRALEQVAPTEVTLRGGRRLTVNYDGEKGPWVASRIQDFFGMAEGPTLGPQRHAITLHLLAPNGRPAQVTRDLAGFWVRHYAEVRKELRRRYAKHHWPEDGLNAEPRAGTRK